MSIIIIAFIILVLMSIILILPGWYAARKKFPQNPAILGAGLVGVSFWILIASLGIGPQSLSNLIETPIVAVTAVIIAYVKMFLLESKKIKFATMISFGMIIIVVLALRLFMPLIPE
ncbi:MAG: hypothetical protein HQ557_16210 [Bacteroidetes bacterium]|nr:hypothetical protein [Bacteroidota bacterium]